jgi:solute carrier family 25 carnitine/acylcarnitine transporter 20/29
MADNTVVKKEEESFALRFWRDLVAGTAGGVAQTLSGHPLDTLKVRLQTMPTPAPGEAPMYTGMVDCVRKTVKSEGPLGLYKGVGSPLAGLAIINAVLFVTYGNSKHFVKNNITIGSQSSRTDPRDPTQMSIAQYFLTGSIVGVVASFVDCPVDLFKTQMQVQGQGGSAAAYKNVVHCASSIMKNYGFAGAFQGMIPTLLRDVPANSAYFGIYELTRRWLTPKDSTVDKLPMSKVLLAGGLGGVGFWLTTYPIDVIKSSIQADSPDKSKRKYHGVLDCAKKIHQRSGIGGFFKGFTPCLIRAFVANATCFLAYEYTRSQMTKK